jgi:hypothetical protein
MRNANGSGTSKASVANELHSGHALNGNREAQTSVDMLETVSELVTPLRPSTRSESLFDGQALTGYLRAMYATLNAPANAAEGYRYTHATK